MWKSLPICHTTRDQTYISTSQDNLQHVRWGMLATLIRNSLIGWHKIDLLLKPKMRGGTVRFVESWIC